MNSLAVQWLGLSIFIAEDPDSICGQGTKIRQATQDGKKKRRLRRPTDRRKLRQDPSSNRPAVKEKSDTIGEILNMARILKLLGVYCEFS